MDTQKDKEAGQQTGNTIEPAAGKPINPFEQSGHTAADTEATEEEAAAEQQRKEALTERH